MPFATDTGTELHEHLLTIQLQKKRQECVDSGSHKSEVCKQLYRFLAHHNVSYPNPKKV